MKRPAFFLVICLASTSAIAAEVTIEACVSTVFTEVATGTDVAGFASTCYPLSGQAEPSQNIAFKSSSDAERRDFFVGLCNTSGATAKYTARHELRYSVEKSEFDGERVDVEIRYDPIAETATGGGGTLAASNEFEVEDGYCYDFLFNLTTRYEIFTGLDPYTIQRGEDFNGLFYDPDNPGHGFDFNAHEQGLTVYYYGHTRDGERLWLISDLYTGELQAYRDIRIDLYEVPEGTFGVPQVQDGTTRWGTLEFTLYECDSGYATLDGKDGRLSMNLERIVGLKSSACP